MRFHAVTLLGLFFLQAVACAEEASPLKTQKDKVSYSIGLNIGKDFKRQLIDIDPKLLVLGIQDVLSGRKQLLTEDEAHKVMETFQLEMQAKRAAQNKEKTDQNTKAGNAFLAENKQKKGVVTLPSGLQYKIITEGSGEKPKATDTVKTHYRGTLIDGTEFDSSYKRGEPAVFPVSGVIAGWTEALQLMPVGSKWQLFIPSPLAYGERGAGPTIGPNATLIFEVELLRIEEDSKK